MLLSRGLGWKDTAKPLLFSKIRHRCYLECEGLTWRLRAFEGSELFVGKIWLNLRGVVLEHCDGWVVFLSLFTMSRLGFSFSRDVLFVTAGTFVSAIFLVSHCVKVPVHVSKWLRSKLCTYFLLIIFREYRIPQLLENMLMKKRQTHYMCFTIVLACALEFVLIEQMLVAVCFVTFCWLDMV